MNKDDNNENYNSIRKESDSADRRRHVNDNLLSGTVLNNELTEGHTYLLN